MTDHEAELEKVCSSLEGIVGDQHLLPGHPIRDAARLLREMAAALKPLSQQYELNDCDERSADDAMEISIADLRRARDAYQALTKGKPQ